MGVPAEAPRVAGDAVIGVVPLHHPAQSRVLRRRRPVQAFSAINTLPPLVATRSVPGHLDDQVYAVTSSPSATGGTQRLHILRFVYSASRTSLQRNWRRRERASVDGVVPAEQHALTEEPSGSAKCRQSAVIGHPETTRVGSSRVETTPDSINLQGLTGQGRVPLGFCEIARIDFESRWGRRILNDLADAVAASSVDGGVPDRARADRSPTRFVIRASRQRSPGRLR